MSSWRALRSRRESLATPTCKTRSRVYLKRTKYLTTRRKRLSKRSQQSWSRLKMRSKTRSRSSPLKSRNCEASVRNTLSLKPSIMIRRSSTTPLCRTLTKRRASWRRKWSSYLTITRAKSLATTLITSRTKSTRRSSKESATRPNSWTHRTNVWAMSSRVTLSSSTQSCGNRKTLLRT